MGKNNSCFGLNQNVYQGSGCINSIAEILRKENWNKLLVVAGPTIIRIGVLARVEDILKSAGVEYRVFSQVEANPHVEELEKGGLSAYRAIKPDAILALGGGSTIESAKGIAAIAESGSKKIYTLADKSDDYPRDTAYDWHVPPIIAVETTANCSAFVSTAVLSDGNHRKIVINNNSLVPRYALCDPELLATMPPHIAAASAMDSLIHAVECMVSLASNDFSQTMSRRAIELIGPNIIKFYYNRANMDFADAVSKGSMYAGFASNNSYPAQNHYSNLRITQYLHIPHGDAAAIMMPWFIEWNSIVCKEQFWYVYNLLNPNNTVKLENFEVSMLVECFKNLNRTLNILNGKTLADFGCTQEVCRDMVSEFRESPNFPRTTTQMQMYTSLLEIMNGKYV